ncbi:MULTISPECIES: DegV family EDD domain-containing protein [Fusobacterium]|jgi:DAK2 domain fusion protein YloV|uniref:DegV family EDD domain-containing protein n=2 Tax=Fusobacterium mortiferum TaxID=850 RepID=A0A414PMN6_FUSMR|nr:MULTISPECIES: DegV family EDD domain-containing protein [Fusobacterium]MCI7665278.1 DegV family EDD domain-containing protein [Fusobacterium mortiferum]MDD7262066.1 DegV family EDD domain-containing protein [Fusobacterium mortiferum]MDY2800908.1 DegV family EDD domain-containing protein [Fusobacterium mortiferum]MDY5980460.1 DegV family EDD domain-containing protein [Fusobacterium mortiferum]MSS62211.1 DegV family EDD domain-containing protein [Fusobacterium sp. FSA-380-WT-2B]
MKLEIKVLNSMRLTKLLIAASRWLSKYADVLNDLNVYPVPDGDTGTNMSMTLQAVENELIKLNHEPNMKELVEIVSEAILLGARGNSGTILSQIIQGFLSSIEDKEEITVDDVIKAFGMAKERAYQAVSEPVEGTMLTVIRRVAEEAAVYQGNKDDFILFLVHLKNVAKEAVEETPNLLPKLKEAGVVDAGGKGIFYVLEGFEKSVTDPEMLKDLERIVQSQAKRKERMEYTFQEPQDIKFRYCTEFIIEEGTFDLEGYKKEISSLGDSMVCAQTTHKTKTHIHTNNPGQVLEIAIKYGQLNNIKIENMAFQHKNLLVSEKEIKSDNRYIIKNENSGEMAYFAIVDNRKLGEYYLEAGATGILVGGQTQNPSVHDIEEGIKKIQSNKIILLPNNKNIISTAKIVAERSKKDILVLETKSMLEGYYLVKNKEEKLETIVEKVKNNYSIEITQAVRDTRIDDIEIKVGDYIALVNGKIKEKNKDLQELVETITQKYISDESLNIIISYGKEADKKVNKVFEKLENIDKKELFVEQENYHYYIYIEQRDLSLPEIAIVTDSTSDLTPELMGDLNIDIIPLKIKIGEDYYKDGIELTKRDFWKRVTSESIIPKTSQPSPAEFKEIYERLFKKGYKKIISIHISSKLSGTQQAARVAKGMVARGENITIVDSKAVAMSLGYQVLEAARMAREGMSEENILSRLEQLQDRIKLYFVVNDISYLEKGGRIGRASSVIGGFLKVKPILKLENGEISVQGKVFGESGALGYMERLIRAESKKTSMILYTAWGGTRKELLNADEIKNQQSGNNKIEYRGRFEIGATIGAHSGPVYGFAIIPKII